MKAKDLFGGRWTLVDIATVVTLVVAGGVAFVLADVWGTLCAYAGGFDATSLSDLLPLIPLVSIVGVACVAFRRARRVQVRASPGNLTEGEWRQGAAQQDLILRSLPMALHGADPSAAFRTKWVSPRIDRICGFGSERFMAEPDLWLKRLHPDDRERVLGDFAKLLHSDSIATEYRWRTADDTYRWYLDQPVVIRDELGDPKEIIGTWLDITERKISEPEVRRLNEDLEHKVDERTAELSSANESLRREVSERQRAGEALRQSEASTRAILQTAAEGIVVIDDQGTVTTFNAAAEKIFGYEAKDVVGRNVSLLMPPPYEAERDGYIKHYRETGVRSVIGKRRELVGRRKDGSTFPMELHVSEVRLGERSVFTGIVTDVAGRTLAEEALRHKALQQAAVAELGLRALSGIESSVLLEAAVKSVAETLNVEFSKVFAYIPEREMLRLVSGVGWRAGIVGRAEVDAGGGSQAGYTLLRKEPVIVDDLRRETRFVGPALLTDHGVISGLSVVIPGTHQPYGVLGAHTRGSRRFTSDDANFLQAVANVLGDAMLRSRADEALRESETQFRQLAENIDEVFWLTDWIKRELIYVSPAYATVFGRSCQSLYANRHGWLDAIVPDDRARVAESFAKNAPLGKYVEEEYRITHSDGGLHWIRDRAFPLRNEAGTVYRIIGVAEDITDRKRAEEQARQQQTQLAHVSRLNTMGEMATGIAHELNQPLSAVMNFAEACIRKLKTGTVDPEEMMSIMERITSMADRGGQIIRRLRELVRKRDPIRSNLDLNELVGEATGWVAFDASRHDIDVELELADHLPPVFAESIQIQQVVLNLLRNGIEALESADTEPRILVVRTARCEPDMLAVTVTDTGPGLSPAVRDRLFEPFMTSKPQGLGMGLSISSSIIDAHGGRLWAEPNATRGVAFHFTLPVAGTTSTI